MKSTTATALVLLCVGISTSAPGHTQNHPAGTRSVPTVGCFTHGQTGTEDTPGGLPISVRSPPQLAKLMAYYESGGGLGELGPVGWQCLAWTGSYGGSVWIGPERSSISDAEVAGPIVFVQTWALDTSGRLAAASIIARLFRHSARAQSFVAQVKREGLIPAEDFAASPYPADRLHYPSDLVVEFSTPAGNRGIGTEKLFDAGHLLQPSRLAVRGIAALSFDDDRLVIVRVRVPPNLEPVGTEILRLERECLMTGATCIN